MFQEAWPPVFARQQRQPQAGLAAENMYIVHWASVAAIAHSQAAENTPKSFVWSAPSHELLACESWKSLHGGGGLGDGGGGEGDGGGGEGDGGGGEGDGGDGGGGEGDMHPLHWRMSWS